MGDCKDNMKLPDKEVEKGKDSIFGKIMPRKRKDVDLGNSAETYGHNIAKADEKLQELMLKKQAELTSEKGNELSNSLKYGNFRNQQMHLDAIIDLMNDYLEIK
jgi:hypothetical protein